MGRSVASKRRKRRRQKQAKKQAKKRKYEISQLLQPSTCTPNTQIEETDIINHLPSSPVLSSLGSPSSIPPSPSSSWDDSVVDETSPQEKQFPSVDTDCLIQCYDEFEKEVKLMDKDDGLIIEHLLKFNRKLADKANFYRKEWEETLVEVGKVELQCTQRVTKVRQFYKQILFSNDRKAVIFRKALDTRH